MEPKVDIDHPQQLQDQIHSGMFVLVKAPVFKIIIISLIGSMDLELMGDL